MISTVFNNETYLYEYNKCSDGYAVRLILPNEHWITKYISYSGYLHKTIGEEQIPVECMMDLDNEFIEKYKPRWNDSNEQIRFKYEINYAKKPLKYWQPDYSYGAFSRYGNIVENTITKIGWFIYTRTYNEEEDKEEIETSVKSVLQTLFDIEKF